MLIAAIQRRLAALGIHPGPEDGLYGRRTIAAVKAFQRLAGLPRDGLAGAKTLAKLLGTPLRDPPDPALPWLETARGLMGTREIAGPPTHPAIRNWARRIGLAAFRDETPWCGLFLAHCIGSTLPEEVLPANPLGARNWARFGNPAQPREGAILVFWRGSPASWKGHVGLYAGEADGAFQVLGGNQANSVSIAPYARSRLIAARWPSTWPPPESPEDLQSPGSPPTQKEV